MGWCGTALSHFFLPNRGIILENNMNLYRAFKSLFQLRLNKCARFRVLAHR